MRSTPLPKQFFTLSLTLSLLTCNLAWGQTAASQAAPASSPTPLAAAQAKPAVEQRTERIRVEDGGAVIDELRVGGETKSIDVQPKGGMPSYQVAPKSGERSWKVLGF